MTTRDAIFLLPLALPAFHLVIGCCGVLRQRWQIASWLSTAGLGTALASVVLALTPIPWGPSTGLVSAAPASHLLALLVAFLGLVISRFSRNYLEGEAREARYATMLHLTLAAVALVVLTDNLLVLLAAWVGVSLTLNELLLFYPERQRAVLAAHKKFLFARLAELALVVAALLLYHRHGTWEISQILAAYPAELTAGEHLAALLLALAALIRCAQLPMHGWLIQVVEAPTPVSALLHAGIINLGGYLLILFAPLLSSSSPAEALLLVVAGLTTALAGLIMTTRVSVKVKLAWSTTAQMGLMLVECALGLYELALLHLLAHACYKAYLFLRAGSVVEQHIERQLVSAPRPSVGAWLGAGALALCVSLLAAQLVTPGGAISPWLPLAAFLTLLLAERGSGTSRTPPAQALALGLVLMSALVAQKMLLGGAVGTGPVAGVSWFADLWVGLLILLVCASWSLLQHAPRSTLARRMSTWLFAGLYLDEWVTRTTLRLWPPLLPFRLNRKRLNTLTEEVQ